MSKTPTRIRLVVTDLAGTTLDHGCFGPIAAFMLTFERYGVTITAEQARGPMGLHKRDHIRELLKLPEVEAAWRAAHNRDWTEDDVERMFKVDFMPLQMEALADHSKLVAGTLPMLARLAELGIPVATTTGYFREANDAVLTAAAAQGFVPAHSAGVNDVPAGRPEPWMLYRCMEATSVYPPAAVLKVGDTIPDIGEARNAGCWAVAVTLTGSEVGWTEAELAAAEPVEIERRRAAATARLLAAGAHEVIDSVADLPACLDRLNARLAAGERP